jgi:hypothetical protein
MSNGKGDTPRNCYTEKYRNNYDEIFRKSNRLPTVSSVCSDIDNTLADNKDNKINENKNKSKRQCKRCSDDSHRIS